MYGTYSNESGDTKQVLITIEQQGEGPASKNKSFFFSYGILDANQRIVDIR